MRYVLPLCAAGIALGVPAVASADVREFIFADVGTTYTGIIFPSDPIVGQQVVLTRIFLEVEVFPGADAAFFDTDVSFPLTPFPGNRNVLAITGADLGWSGSGRFSYMLETTQFNGTFLSTIYGAATTPLDAGILEGSRIEMVTVPAPGVLALLGVAGLATRRRR